MSTRMRARRTVIAIAAAVAACSVVGLCLIFWSKANVGAPPVVELEPPRPLASPAVLLPPGDVTRLQEAVSSDDPSVTVSSLVPVLRETYLEQPARLIPDGATGVIDTATLAATDGVATVDVEVIGGPAPGRWLLLLQQVDGQWLIFGTERP